MVINGDLAERSKEQLDVDGISGYIEEKFRIQLTKNWVVSGRKIFQRLARWHDGH